MQTLVPPEKSKTAPATAMHTKKRQPFFAPVKVRPVQAVGNGDESGELATATKAEVGIPYEKTYSQSQGNGSPISNAGISAEAPSVNERDEPEKGKAPLPPVQVAPAPKGKSAPPPLSAKAKQIPEHKREPAHQSVTSNTGELLSQLQQTQASSLGQTFNEILPLSAQSLELKRSEAASRLPKVPEEAGSIYGGNIKGLKPLHKAKTGIAKLKNESPQSQEQGMLAEPISLPPAKESRPDTNTSLNVADEELAARAGEELDNINLDTASIPDDFGSPPPIVLSGEADPRNVDQEYAEQQLEVSSQKEDAAKEIGNDHGEHDIVPRPTAVKIVSNRKLKHAPAFKGKSANPVAVPGFTQELDTALGPEVERKIGEQKAVQDSEDLRYQQETDAAYQQADSEIADASLQSRQQQFSAGNKAVEDADSARAEWQEELNGVESTFRQEAAVASQTAKADIRARQNKGTEEIAQHYADSKNKVAKEKKAAEEKAKQEKQKKKKESGGFFGWLRNKAAAFVDAVKRAVNAIMDGLRAAVKWVLTRLKELVQGVIDMVRDAVTGFIKAFGAALKGLVNIAFFAFPAIRDKINGKIDQAVNKAVDIANSAFDTFKKVVGGIIDFVAETVDKLLSIIQKVWSGVLTVVSMIIKGEIGEIFRRLGYIVDAISAVSFDTIKQGGIEELMGANLDEPLAQEEIMAAVQMGLLPASGNGGISMPQPPWSEANVGVDAVSAEELSPEIQSELMQMARTGTNETELGGKADPMRTMDAVMKEATGGASQPAEQTKQKRDDGLSPMQRAEVKWGMMKQGISKWWDENWGYVVAGIVGAIVAFIAAEIVSGGAITAALPAIMPVLEYVFAGIAVAQFGTYFVDFLEKAWNGDKKGGTKALSRGLGAALIELAMYLGFGALKLAGKAAKAVAKGVVTIGKQAAKAIIRGMKFLIEKGKVLFNGIAGKGFGKAFKSIRKFGEELLEHTRFRKFRIRLTGLKFKVEGFINPWILLASGDLQEVTQKELQTLTKKKNTFRVGEGFKYLDESGKEIEGVVVGSHAKPSAYLQQLEEIKAAKGAQGLKDEFKVLKKELEVGGDLEKIIYNRQSTYELRKGIEGIQPENFQAHHVIPRELNGSSKFKDFFRKIGFNIEDGAKNGIMMPPNKTVLNASKQADEFANFAMHQGSHPKYTAQIEQRLIRIAEDHKKGLLNSAQALNRVEKLVESGKNAIKNGNGKMLNEIIVH
jgi:hypothetical protein